MESRESWASFQEMSLSTSLLNEELKDDKKDNGLFYAEISKTSFNESIDSERNYSNPSTNKRIKHIERSRINKRNPRIIKSEQSNESSTDINSGDNRDYFDINQLLNEAKVIKKKAITLSKKESIDITKKFTSITTSGSPPTTISKKRMKPKTYSSVDDGLSPVLNLKQPFIFRNGSEQLKSHSISHLSTSSIDYSSILSYSNLFDLRDVTLACFRPNGRNPIKIYTGSDVDVYLGALESKGYIVAVKMYKKNSLVNLSTLLHEAHVLSELNHCRNEPTPYFYGLLDLQVSKKYHRYSIITQFLGDPKSFQILRLDDYLKRCEIDRKLWKLGQITNVNRKILLKLAWTVKTIHSKGFNVDLNWFFHCAKKKENNPKFDILCKNIE